MRSSLLVATVLGLAPLCMAAGARAEDAFPTHQLPVSPDGNLVVGLCDGQTFIEVPGVKPDQAMTREEAQKVADSLMIAWRHKHPEAEWVMAADTPQASQQTGTSPVVTHGGKTPNPAAPSAPKASEKGQAQTYGAFTDRDQAIWQASTDALVAEGKRIFHDAKALGSTTAISCDMCHPDAANTHPETYPKYQVQLGRVALLRDMINWCIENPVRGKPFADDDPRLKALEAYILAQRKGARLEYGKH